MRRAVLSLVVLYTAASAGYAQNQKSSFGAIQGTFGSSESATGGLRGVYGPPESAPGQLRGVYGPSQSPSPAPLSSSLSGSANSSTANVPSVSLPGAAVGQSLPEGVQASPMSDRPGYGRAVVNGRPAIIDMNDNSIVQFSD